MLSSQTLNVASVTEKQYCSAAIAHSSAMPAQNISGGRRARSSATVRRASAGASAGRFAGRPPRNHRPASRNGPAAAQINIAGIETSVAHASTPKTASESATPTLPSKAQPRRRRSPSAS